MSSTPAPRNSRFVTALFLVVFASVIATLIHLVSVFTTALVLGTVLFTLSYPSFAWVLQRVGNRRRVAAALTTAGVVVVVLLPLFFVLTSLSSEAIGLYQRLTAGEDSFLQQLRSFLDSENPGVLALRHWGEGVGLDLSPDALRARAASVGASIAGSLYERLGGVASNTVAFLMHFGLMVVILMGLLVEGPQLKAYLLDLSPLPDEQEEMLVQRFASISRAVFLGNGVASVAQGICGGVGFALFGVGSGVLWGTAIAFFAFLPIVGASVIFVPACILLLLNGDAGTALGFAAYNAVYVAVLEYGLKPKLIGGQSELNGVLVFTGILAGLSLFGILGIFYGPLILTMFVTLAEIYKSEYREDLMARISPWVSADRTDAGGEAQS